MTDATRFDMSSLQPRDATTVRWVVLHRTGPDRPWFCTWCSELAVAGTAAEAEQEIEAHKALDRSYGGLEGRLVKQTNRVHRVIEDVPAMWEAEP